MRKTKLILSQVLGRLRATQNIRQNLGPACSSLQLWSQWGCELESLQEQGLQRLCPSTAGSSSPLLTPPALPSRPPKDAILAISSNNCVFLELQPQ